MCYWDGLQHKALSFSKKGKPHLSIRRVQGYETLLTRAVVLSKGHFNKPTPGHLAMTRDIFGLGIQWLEARMLLLLSSMYRTALSLLQ